MLIATSLERKGSKMESEDQVNKRENPRIEDETKTSAGRRKLIRGALVGAPVLLALKSTPVLACSNCKQPSGFSTSGNLSRNGSAAIADPAHAPWYWANQTTGDYFANTTILKSTKFKEIFNGSHDKTKLSDVLTSGTEFNKLVVAAYLDVKEQAFVAGISEANIIAMWKGTYAPTPTSATWLQQQTVNYLKYTMGL